MGIEFQSECIPPIWGPEQLTFWLKQWAGYVNGTSFYVLKEWDNAKGVYALNVKTVKDMHNSLSGFHVDYYDRNGNLKSFTGEDFLKNSVMRYAHMTFDPSSPDPKTNIVKPEFSRPDKRLFNRFRGFPFTYSPSFMYNGPDCVVPAYLIGRSVTVMPVELKMKYDLYDGHPAEMFIRHAFEVLCNGDTDAFEYLLKWTAHILQYPSTKPGTAVLIMSAQGAGKNVWFEVIKRLIGTTYYTYVKQKEHLQSKFNAHLGDKILAVVDECTFGGCHEVNNIIKSLITQEEAILEKKGVDGVLTSMCERYTFLSNEEWPIRVEVSDRRYLCLSASSGRVADKAYFDYFMEYYKQQETLEGLFNFLVSVQGVGNVLPPPPTTELKRDLQEKSMALEVQFLRDIAKGEDETLSLNIKDGDWVTTDALFFVFKNWVESNNCGQAKNIGRKRLGQTLVKVLGNQKAVDGCKVNGSNSLHRVRAYLVDFATILQYRG